jgi:ERCC4-related helicase
MNTFPYLQMALDNPEMLKLHADKLNPQLLNMVDKFKWKHHKKLEVLLDICLDHVKERNEKGIIWIYHPDTAKRLAKELEDFNPLVIIGETENREEIIAKFKKDPKHKILIASIPILNTSVTLIESKWQVYFERVYAYNQFKQSIKRISRIGQDKETNTYILIFSRTIDVMLDLNLETKDVINNKILSKDFLSKDEWRRIFTFDGDTNSLGF